MASIKLRGVNDFVKIDDIRGKVIKTKWEENPNSGELIKLDDISFKINKIDLVILENEGEDKDNERIKEAVKSYYDWKIEFLKLTPKEKAEQNSWGSFKLFYWGIYFEKPQEEMKQKVREIAEKYYAEYPERSYVSMKCWFDFLKLNKNFKMNSMCLRMLENVEMRYWEDKVRDEDYKKEIEKEREERIDKISENEDNFDFKWKSILDQTI